MHKCKSCNQDVVLPCADPSDCILGNKTLNARMPFTGHDGEHLANTLKSITDSGLPVEIFDAFLAEYARTKDLDKARFFAMCEWDC